MNKNYRYKAKLIRIIDGDTIVALIDLGFEIATRKKIRLYGINAPETRTLLEKEKAAGILAKQRLEELLGASNGEFELISHGWGKFGRCLGEIFINDQNPPIYYWSQHFKFYHKSVECKIRMQ